MVVLASTNVQNAVQFRALSVVERYTVAPSRPRTHDDEQVAELIKLVVENNPEHASRWSVRSVAASGISKSTVGLYFALFGLQPHRSKTFKLSTDPFFAEKG